MEWDINSGNPAYDNLCRKELMEDNLLVWSLITYLEKKGLLNRHEFFDTISEEAKYRLIGILDAEAKKDEDDMVF